MLTTLYLLGAVITLVAALFSNLLSPRPRTLRAHLVAIGRLGVFAAATASAARVLQYGAPVTREQAVLMLSLALLYVVQAWTETDRQGRR